MPPPLSLSVIMPALNEAGNIGAAIADTLTAFDTLTSPCELIVVNDGSTDATPEIARRYAHQDRRVSVLDHDRPMGIGRSFRDGLAVARHDIVVFYPGDNEMIAAEMLRYLPLMREVDVVVPHIVNTAVRSPIRRTLSQLYRHLVTTLLQIRVRHTNGMILYRKAVIADITLRSDGFLYQTELLAKTLRCGYLYAEVPYFIRPRLTGESKANAFASIGGLIGLASQIIELVREVYAFPRLAVRPDSATARRREQTMAAGVTP